MTPSDVEGAGADDVDELAPATAPATESVGTTGALVTAAAAAAPVAGHAAAGTGLLSAPHASGYTHPDTTVTICAVSCASNQPLPTLAVTLAEGAYDGGGSVTAARVAV